MSDPTNGWLSCLRATFVGHRCAASALYELATIVKGCAWTFPGLDLAETFGLAPLSHNCNIASGCQWQLTRLLYAVVTL